MKLLNNIFNSIKNRILVSISFALLFLQSNAQIYPVQISGQLTPPYSGFIQDYAEPGSEQLRIILHFNDFSKSNYDVKLKFVIKGNGFSMSSKQFLNLSPISLNPGQPILISGSDLAPYLSANNLDFVGINQSSYIQNKSLPEGYYSICITAFDYNTNIKVSNEFCVNAWFTYSNPPLLNFPVCNSNIAPLNPQNILFQWTPVNVGSPNSALNTVYDFMLYEIRPDSNANPNQIVLSTAPIFSTTVSQPFLNYGIVEPNLNLYMKYVWRVRVRDITGRDWFTNNGFSQICTFTYGSASNVLGGASKLSLNTNAISHRMGKADWNKQASFSSYRLQVKKQGTENWFDFIVNESTEKIPNLEPNTTYVCRVRGEGTFTGDWSEESEFTTPNEPNYSCNNANFFPDILNAKPLPIEKAISGMIIQTGQFEVLVEQIAPNGPPGWYKGNGRAQSLSGLFVNVKWEAIYIDDNQRHQQGIIEAETKGVDKWLQQWDLVQAQENAHYTDGKIDSIYINGNQVCYTFPGNSNEICVPTPSNSNVMVVRDSEGNEYQIQLVPAPPKIVGKSNYFNFSSDSLNCNDSLKVVFKGLNNQQFGFDEKQYAAWHDNYEIIKLKTTNYFVPNKSVGHSETDVVMAEITLPYFEEKDLSFKTGKNNTLNYELLGQTKAIVKDIPADAGYIYAYYKNKKVGKLTIVSLDKLEKELVLVPVNGTNLDINKDSLNKTFAQANVTWKVNVAANFNYDLGNDGLEAADASLFSKYSDEMRALRDAYVKHDTAYNKKAYYVFIVPKFNNPEVKGYMVRGRAVGFMTPLSFGKGSGDRLLAHELSHGAFGLEHSFPKLEKNNTNNLMDYGEGKQLVKSQWYAIQGSKPIFNWFDEEEDGSYTKPEIASAVFYWINKIKVAYKKRTTVKIPKADFAKDINRLNHFAVYNTQLGGIDFKFIRILFL
ncbi:MAG: fibronectin type III domain-containing protein, partial [Bacteroidia bacterium]